MTTREIAFVSGLSLKRVHTISNLGSWRGLTAEVIQRFSAACRVDLLHPSLQRRFWREDDRVYLKNCSHLSQKKMLARLMRELVTEK